MKHIGMPLGIWLLFGKSFKQNLSAVFELTPIEAESVMVEAKEKYKEIIGNLPDFEKGDRFQMNIVSAAMLAAVVLNMPSRPEVEKLTVYYCKSMMTAPMVTTIATAVIEREDNINMSDLYFYTVALVLEGLFVNVAYCLCRHLYCRPYLSCRRRLDI